MKMVKYYLLLVLLSVIGAVLIPFWLVKVLLIWVALCFASVSFAYGFAYPSLFRKRHDGHIPFYIRWIFFPFLLGAQIYNQWQRAHDQVPHVQKITEHIYLAARLLPRDVETLDAHGINAILDVTAEFDGLDWSASSRDFDYLNVPVLDHMPPTQAQLNQAINFIEQHKQKGQKVVVHCALGRGRSVYMVAAYLLTQDDTLSVVDAMQKINAIRSTARLNKHQLSTLKRIKQGGKLFLPPRLALIMNPVAGGGKWGKYQDDIVARLNPHFQVSIFETTESISAQQLAHKALKQGFEIIVAGGGDGTVTEVASALVGQPQTLGIIPLGTANALASVFHGLSSKVSPIATACDVLIEGNSHQIDVAYCNGKLMLLVAAVGFESQMIEYADRENKNAGGQFAYLSGLWQALNKNKILDVTLITEGKETRIETPSVVIANAAPTATALAQGGGQPDVKDGKVDITWLPKEAHRSANFFSLAELVLSGATDTALSSRIVHQRVAEVTVKLASTMAYAIDGEIYESDELRIKTVPQALNVMANSTQLN